MAIKKYNPTTNGRRNMSTLVNEEITTSTPEKSLLAPLKKKGGRNNTGKITVTTTFSLAGMMIMVLSTKPYPSAPQEILF